MYVVKKNKTNYGSIFGVGFSYPFQEAVNKNGPQKLSDEDLVRASIASILGTRQGERPFSVKNGVLYGVRMADGVFESVTVARDIIPYEVKRALQLWEPRIRVESVEAVVLPAEPQTVYATLGYRLRATNRADNFVKPYRLRRA